MELELERGINEREERSQKCKSNSAKARNTEVLFQRLYVLHVCLVQPEAYRGLMRGKWMVEMK